LLAVRLLCLLVFWWDGFPAPEHVTARSAPPPRARPRRPQSPSEFPPTGGGKWSPRRRAEPTRAERTEGVMADDAALGARLARSLDAAQGSFAARPICRVSQTLRLCCPDVSPHLRLRIRDYGRNNVAAARLVAEHGRRSGRFVARQQAYWVGDRRRQQ